MFFCKSSPLCCSTLTQILQRYETASGQRINLTKSTITFSTKTTADTKNRVKLALNIDQEGGIGKYLGLPENFGMKKRDIFASILDKIRQRAHSWSTRFLSSAGKQMLLQAILTALPTYAMTCFKLPVSLCKQIQSVFTRFWWDDKPDKKKMCWVSWKTLTQPKFAGGLGFRDIECFNDALLAKLGWRLLHNPDSLLAKVLLGKYCHSSSFLECSSSPNVASHGWRSILAGREILKQGLGWAVGDGANIKVWSEPWLSLQHPKTPIGPVSELTIDLKVKDLVDPLTKDWNTNAIRAILPQYEEDIRSIIPSSKAAPDSLIWLHEKSGTYSSKSGYCIAKNLPKNPISDCFNWNKAIWQLHLAPKLKHFLWKVASGALAVGSNLAKRGITGITCCKRCGMFEDELHVLLKCEFAGCVWNLAPLVSPPDSTPFTTIQLLLQDIRRLVALPPSGVTLTPLAPWIMWHLWKARNLLLFEERLFSAQEILLKAITDARQWQDAQLSVPLSLPRSQASIPCSTSTDSYCCFVDAAWNPTLGVCGLGWLLKDPNGITILRKTATRPYVRSALIAEALAIRSVLHHVTSLAHLYNIRSLVIFSDSQVIIKLLKSNGSLKELKGILHDVWCLQEALSSISFSFIPRLNNLEADALSKTALSFANNSSLVECN